MKHTKGPWDLFPYEDIVIGPLESHSNLVRHVATVERDDLADAERIVACVNGCDAAGITRPDALPKATVFLQDLFDRCDGSVPDLNPDKLQDELAGLFQDLGL